MPKRKDSYQQNPEYPDSPEFEGLNDRQIQFMLAVQQFFKSWPDDEVAQEFEVTHKVLKEIIAKVKDGKTFQFIAQVHEGEGKDEKVTRIPLIVQKDKHPLPDTDRGCWFCWDEFCPCFIVCGSC